MVSLAWRVSSELSQTLQGRWVRSWETPGVRQPGECTSASTHTPEGPRNQLLRLLTWPHGDRVSAPSWLPLTWDPASACPCLPIPGLGTVGVSCAVPAIPMSPRPEAGAVAQGLGSGRWGVFLPLSHVLTSGS